MERKKNKNDALEALDFIINVLREHEKDLDRLINQLGIITKNLGEVGAISDKIERMEERISNIQSEITSHLNRISVPKSSSSPTITSLQKPIKVKCTKWEEFKILATDAETVSYLFKISENSFQADALKNGKIVSFIGELPPSVTLLKLWLSKELNVDNDVVFEGVLNIG